MPNTDKLIGFYKTKIPIDDFDTQLNAAEAERIKSSLLRMLGDQFISSVSKVSVSPFSIKIFVSLKSYRLSFKRKFIQSVSRLEKELDIYGISVIEEYDGMLIVIPKFDDTARNLFRITENAPRSADSFCLGINTDGEALFTTLKQARHLLLAAKPTFPKNLIHTVLVSLLNNESNTRLLIYDTLVNEYSAYSALPNMMAPVLRDATELEAALEVICREIEVRYMQLSEKCVRSIDDFNVACALGGHRADVMQKIVIVIDDLSILSEDKSPIAENCIARILCKGAPVGVHIILVSNKATDKAIPKLFRTKCPIRICFRFPTPEESLKVLGEAGAERLSPNGDMICSVPWSAKNFKLISPQVKGRDLIEFIEERATADKYYDAKIMNAIEAVKNYNAAKELSVEEIVSINGFSDAAMLAVKVGYVSVLDLETRLDISYRRAVTFITAMQKLRVIDDRGELHSKKKAVISEMALIKMLKNFKDR